MSRQDLTLVFLKPGVMERGLVGTILSRFEAKDLEIVGLKLLRMSREEAREFYSVHRGKPFFEDLVETVSRKDMVAAVLRGREVVRVVREMIGVTDPVEAAPGTIRGDFGLGLTDNLIHASDSRESFEAEVSILFPELDLSS
ncbi:MAG: nucleoside-diphosphate kinase [Candidatus Geothermarchaeales archaeon]